MNRLRLSGLIAMIYVILVGCNGNNPVTIDDGTTPDLPSAPTPTRQPEDRGSIITPTPAAIESSALETIRERGVLRVGVLYNNPPFASLTDQGNLAGYEIDLMNAVGEQWGIDIEFVQVTRQTRLDMLESGAVDILAATMPQTRDLEQFVEYTDTHFQGGYALLVQSINLVDSLSDFQGGKVGVISQAGSDALLAASQRSGVNFEPVMYESLEEATDDLLFSGELRGVAGRREELMLVASTTDGVDVLPDLLVIEPYALAVRHGDTALRDLLNLTLQELDTAGDYSLIFSENFYRYTSDSFRTFTGEASFTFDTFPTDINSGESVVQRIRQGEPLRIAGMDLTNDPEPFDGQPIVDGFNRAVINEMARRWNVPVVEKPDSTGENGLRQLESGEADIFVGAQPDRSMVGRIAYSDPYYQRGIRVAHLEGVSVLSIGNLDFRDALALPPVSVTTDLIEDNNGFPVYAESDDLEGALEELLDRNVVALVGDEYSIILMAQSEEDLELVEDRYRPADFVMGMPVTDSQFHALVNFTLQDMQADDTLNQLRQQYFGPYVPEGEEIETPELAIWPGNAGFLNVGTFASN